MKKLFILSVLLIGLVISGTVYPWGSTGGDGSSIYTLQETAVFFNNSGSTLWTGAVVVIDLTSSDATTGTTLGSYVTVTNKTDSNLVVGTVKIAADDNMPVVVITHGPADTSYQGSSDGHTSIGDTVGTTNKNGYAGAGSRLGFIMENITTDGSEAWMWINPHNAE